MRRNKIDFQKILEKKTSKKVTHILEEVGYNSFLEYFPLNTFTLIAIIF